MAVLTNSANVVIGDDITRITNVYQDSLLLAPVDDASSGFSNDEMANDDTGTNWINPGRGAMTEPASGYLLFFSYLPSSYVTPDYPTFTLLATPGVLIEEGGGSSAETWGVVGE